MRALTRRPPGEDALRASLVEAGASLRPRPPSPIWEPWVNTALRSRADAERARQEVVACGLPPHQDEPKNWDYLITLGLILARVSRSAPILEAGATQYAPLLRWLYLYGYRHLWGIDPIYRGPRRAGPIQYDAQDVTATRFPDKSFAALACLSVVEHGVDLEAYLGESARLLRPGGLLITSTDYWCDPIDTGGQFAYGVPIHIFTGAELESFAALARVHGFRLVRPLSIECVDRPVKWSRYGLDYTFVTVVLERTGA
jgi:SAM-dependent methyltransferase